VLLDLAVDACRAAASDSAGACAWPEAHCIALQDPDLLRQGLSAVAALLMVAPKLETLCLSDAMEPLLGGLPFLRRLRRLKLSGLDNSQKLAAVQRAAAAGLALTSLILDRCLRQNSAGRLSMLPALFGMSSLRSLQLTGLSLGGLPPNAIGGLPQLTELRVDHHAAALALSTALGRLSQLRRLHLAVNLAYDDAERDLANFRRAMRQLHEHHQQQPPQPQLQLPVHVQRLADTLVQLDITWECDEDDVNELDWFPALKRLLRLTGLGLWWTSKYAAYPDAVAELRLRDLTISSWRGVASELPATGRCWQHLRRLRWVDNSMSDPPAMLSAATNLQTLVLDCSVRLLLGEFDGRLLASPRLADLVLVRRNTEHGGTEPIEMEQVQLLSSLQRRLTRDTPGLRVMCISFDDYLQDCGAP